MNEGLERLGPKEVVGSDEEEGYVFSKTGLESVALPSTLREVPQNTFWACEDLQSVRFAEGLEKIGVNAFQETAVEQVVFPASLKTISQGAFCKCASLWTAELPEGLEVLGTDEHPSDGGTYCGVFEGSAIESIKLPQMLRVLEYSTFEGCRNLKSIRLPERLRFVGARCFFGCRLAEIAIPASVV